MRASVTIRFAPSRLCSLNSRIGATDALSKASRRAFSSSTHALATYGFIGLGRMGYPMALNLRNKLQATDTLFVHDQNTDVAKKLEEETKNADDRHGANVEVVDAPRDAAEQSDTLLTVLPSAPQVRQVFQSILRPSISSNPSRLFIDCSTISPIASREVADAVHATHTGRFVDAPMSGGVVGAQAASLTFMFGISDRAEDKIIRRVKDTLTLMGKKVHHMGRQSTGLSAKLANNYLLAVSNIAVCEAMNLGVQSGLNPNALGDLINGSSGRCWSSEVNNPVPGVSKGAPAERGYEGGFSLELMEKDLKLAVETAKQRGILLELAEQAEAVYEHVKATEAGKDFSVVYKWLGGQT